MKGLHAMSSIADKKTFIKCLTERVKVG